MAIFHLLKPTFHLLQLRADGSCYGGSFHGQEERQSGGCPLQLANLYNDPIIIEGGSMMEETSGPVAGASTALGQSQLGPWMATSRIWQPHPVQALAIPWKEDVSNSETSGPGSSPS